MPTLRDHRAIILQALTQALDACLTHSVQTRDAPQDAAPLRFQGSLTFTFEGTTTLLRCCPALDFTRELTGQLAQDACTISGGREVPDPKLNGTDAQGCIACEQCHGFRLPNQPCAFCVGQLSVMPGWAETFQQALRDNEDRLVLAALDKASKPKLALQQVVSGQGRPLHPTALLDGALSKMQPGGGSRIPDNRDHPIAQRSLGAPGPLHHLEPSLLEDHPGVLSPRAQPYQEPRVCSAPGLKFIPGIEHQPHRQPGPPPGFQQLGSPLGLLDPPIQTGPQGAPGTRAASSGSSAHTGLPPAPSAHCSQGTEPPGPPWQGSLELDA